MLSFNWKTKQGTNSLLSAAERWAHCTSAAATQPTLTVYCIISGNITNVFTKLTFKRLHSCRNLEHTLWTCWWGSMVFHVVNLKSQCGYKPHQLWGWTPFSVFSLNLNLTPDKVQTETENWFIFSFSVLVYFKSSSLTEFLPFTVSYCVYCYLVIVVCVWN